MESESHDQQPVEEAGQPGEEGQARKAGIQAQAEESTLQEEPAEIVEAVEAEALQPIYEFPPENQFAQAPADGMVAPPANLAGVPLEEAVRRGLIYPPPPAFYQNMPEVTQRAPLPPTWQQPGLPGGKVLPSVAPYGYQPGTLPPLPAAPQPGAGMHPQAQKPSRTWVWIVVSFFSLVVLLSCGLCGWGFFSIFNTSFQLANGAITTVHDYYDAIEQKDYAAAYSKLAPQGSIADLTPQAFMQQAQQRDQQYGPVTSYVYGQPSFTVSGQPDLSHMTMTVSVTRPRLSYTVVLNLQKTGNAWYITDFDRI